MSLNRDVLVSDIKKLSNELEHQYCAEFNFRNHCYLRIAYDNTLNDKWDQLVMRPFTKFAATEQLLKAIQLLNAYTADKNKLLADNANSLAFRKKYEMPKTDKQTTLF